MPKTDNVLSALPLLADALGRKRGVRVHIGGDRAFTDGKNIYIPSLPLDAGKTVLNLARGYTDHESAHLRLTDFEVLKRANLSPIEKHLWNIIEDYAVERDLSALYPGCRQNFLWLIRHIFLEETDSCKEEERSPAECVFDWLLITLRSLAEPELDAERRRLEAGLSHDYPELLQGLESAVLAIPQNSADTKSRIAQARRIAECLKDYVNRQPDPLADNSHGQSAEQGRGQAGRGDHEDSKSSGDANLKGEDGDKSDHSSGESEPSYPLISPVQSLREALDDPSTLQARDIGAVTGALLENESKSFSDCKLVVAEAKPFHASRLSSQEIEEILRETKALRTRLGALLQSRVRIRNQTGRSGRVDTRLLARLSTANPRVFSRMAEKQGLDTLVHLLLDASSSMSGNRIRLACQACFAVAYALTKISGVNVAVTSFPNGVLNANDSKSWATVAQILTAKESLHSGFCFSTSGSTPMAEALWWLLQQMQNSQEERKIVLILSDGEPDSQKEAQRAVEAHRTAGHEVYGIGIATRAMSNLIGDHAKAVFDLQGLHQAIFEMLQGSLLKPCGERQ